MSIFLEFHLPNSATWFYLSLFLAIALFYQFSRPLALRNFDILALFLFAPGFLLVQEANRTSDNGTHERIVGYSWLLAASLFWFVRCLLDLAAGKRPLVSPNLSPAGMGWFGASLFVCLTAVAFSRATDPWEPVGRRPAALAGVQQGATAVVAGAQVAEDETVGFWVERSFAMLCHVAVVAGLLLIGIKRFHDVPTGVAAATLYLLIPYTAFHIGQVHHVWPAALVVWAIFYYRHPVISGALIGLAAGTAFFPLLLLPVWAQFYSGRGALRFMLTSALTGALGVGTTLLVLNLAGLFPDGVWRTMNPSDWVPWRIPTAESIWMGAHWAYRLPVFIAYAGFVLTAFIWPPVRNLGHLIAMSAAVFIGIQFWFADRGGLYVLWYAPLLILLAFRPNLTDHQPHVPGPLPEFLVRWIRWPWERVRSLLPLTPVTLSR